MYSDDELFDVLNDSGERTETTKRRGDIHRDGDWHASVHIWIARRRISGMEFLLQKRADDKDSFPAAGTLPPPGTSTPERTRYPPRYGNSAKSLAYVQGRRNLCFYSAGRSARTTYSMGSAF